MIEPWLAPLWQKWLAAGQADALPQVHAFEGHPSLGMVSWLHRLSAGLLCTDASVWSQGACGHCPGCRYVRAKTHPDLLWLSRDDSGIDAVRRCAETLQHTPRMAPRRVWVIESLDRLSVSAQNALLKLLEEPPSTLWVLWATSCAKQVLPTLHSRSMHWSLPLPSPEALLAWGKSQDLEPSVLQAVEALALPGPVVTADDYESALAILTQLRAGAVCLDKGVGLEALLHAWWALAWERMRDPGCHRAYHHWLETVWMPMRVQVSQGLALQPQMAMYRLWRHWPKEEGRAH